MIREPAAHCHPARVAAAPRRRAWYAHAMSTQTTNGGDGVGRRVITVSELNRDVKLLLEQGLPSLWISGEISNLAQPASGHLYFTLKDAKAQIRCALFRTRGRQLRFQPRNGLQVLARGRVSLFEPRGDYQLIVDAMEDAGEGALRMAFEALRAELEAAGLFAPERKRPLPSHPRRIGVITSPSGAVIRDILHVFKRRFPPLSVLIYPVPVQGADAPERIVAAIALAGARAEVDALILARGGGSLEDLRAFNDERVARAIAACPLPLVSAVGHETDVSISDLVADHRAPTPSAAAEVLSPDQEVIRANLVGLLRRLSMRISRHQSLAQERLRHLERRLRQQHPTRRLAEFSQRLDLLGLRLARCHAWRLQQQQARLLHLRQRLATQAPARRIAQGRERLQGLVARLWRQNPTRRIAQDRRSVVELGHALQLATRRLQARQRERLQTATRGLEHLSPLATVSRGYSILQRADGQLLQRCAEFHIGDRLTARISDGQLQCTVTAILPAPAAGSGGSAG
jgi:exodeoxyribonuclease VII large subunit